MRLIIKHSSFWTLRICFRAIRSQPLPSSKVLERLCVAADAPFAYVKFHLYLLVVSFFSVDRVMCNIYNAAI